MSKVLKAGTYRVTIEFTLENDTQELVLDEAFEDAMNNIDGLFDSDISEYKQED